MRNTRETPLFGGAIADISGANSGVPKLIPYPSTLVGVAMHFTPTLSTGGGIDQTFEVEIDGAGTGVNVIVPDGEDGGLYFLDADLRLPEGSIINLTSGAEEDGATQVDYTYVIKPE